MWGYFFLAILVALVSGAFYYWLIVVTEGVFLGRRFVVWLYNITAHQYDQIKNYQIEEEEILLVEPLLAELKRCKQPWLLDVATGTGRVPLFLLQDGRFHTRLRGKIVALEPSPRMLHFAQQNLHPYQEMNAVTFVRQWAYPLPFADGSFQAVTCLEALEFFPDQEQVLREMWRVLRPGGLLFITRRIGWEAQFFFGRDRTRPGFASWLEELGFVEPLLVDWQNNYDLVIARKSS